MSSSLAVENHPTSPRMQAVALMSADPRQYSLALAEGLTGQPLVLQGYGAAYDALLQVAPAAALTPEAVAKGHALVSDRVAVADLDQAVFMFLYSTCV